MRNYYFKKQQENVKKVWICFYKTTSSDGAGVLDKTFSFFGPMHIWGIWSSVSTKRGKGGFNSFYYSLVSIWSQRSLRSLRAYGNIHSAIFAIVATLNRNDRRDRNFSLSAIVVLRSLRSYGNQAYETICQFRRFSLWSVLRVLMPSLDCYLHNLMLF